jgi:hypothetical protein
MSQAPSSRPAHRRVPFLVVFLGFTVLLFIGILVYAYVEARRANPVMLDEKGAIR